MPLEKAFIPYGGYWSSPFCRWQGALGEVNAVELAAGTTRRFLSQRGLSPDTLDELVVGYTVPQKHSFYGAPWLGGLIGATQATGPIVSQACATSARALLTAALSVETGRRENVLVVTCDRTSNGPQLYYPNPGGPGGMGESEAWVWDNFNRDPWGGTAMLATAENVAREHKITREEQDEITLLRYEQYADALKDDRAFQRRYMVAAEIGKGKRAKLIEADEGVFPTSAEGLAKLQPVTDGGTVTFGSQTHPADGNAGMLVVGPGRKASVTGSAGPTVRLLGFGEARVKKSFMPMAVVPAARQAIQHAGIDWKDLATVKTHNPFAVNDAYFCRETGWPADKMNRFGSSLVYGHPQAPTGLRAVVEMIEELAMAGGGLGLYTGCAAGDTAMALVLKVS